MKRQRLLLHIVLFLATVFTTLLAGAEHLLGPNYFLYELLENGRFSWDALAQGWVFSASFLTFLTFHEFGHYFTAVYHRVKTTLPFYIPIFLPFSFINIGSFGAVIRIKELPGSRRKYFDIGVAGPLAGFVVSVVLLAIGFTTLPDMQSYVGQFHPVFDSLEQAREFFNPVLVVDSNLLYDGMAALLADPADVPPGWEVMHYPLLFAGYLTLFFTALNLLPIGQLDGGHVIYGLFGKKIHGYVSRAAVLVLVFVGGTGLVEPDVYDPATESEWTYGFFQFLKFGLYLGFLYLVARRVQPAWTIGQRFFAAVVLFSVQFLIKAIFPEIEVNGIWLMYAFFAVTFIGLDHPAAIDDTPLDTGRKILGYLALLIFVLCFSFAPLQMR